MFSLDKNESTKALKIIKKARKDHARPTTVRVFETPRRHQLNFSADSLMDFLIWDTFPAEKISPPPILQNFTDEEIENLTEESLPQLLVHNQDCERAVKETSRASACSIGNLQQKGNILATKISRDENNINFNKSDFL